MHFYQQVSRHVTRSGLWMNVSCAFENEVLNKQKKKKRYFTFYANHFW